MLHTAHGILCIACMTLRQQVDPFSTVLLMELPRAKSYFTFLYHHVYVYDVCTLCGNKLCS